MVDLLKNFFLIKKKKIMIQKVKINSLIPQASSVMVRMQVKRKIISKIVNWTNKRNKIDFFGLTVWIT